MAFPTCCRLRSRARTARKSTWRSPTWHSAEIPGIPRNVVHIRRELVLDDRLAERVTLTGYLGAPTDYWIELTIGCDFADIFEVRGWRREAAGPVLRAPALEPTMLELAYLGRDGRLLRTMIRFGRRPDRLTDGPRGGTCASSPTVRSSSNGR